jgi:hypothetical protein
MFILDMFLVYSKASSPNIAILCFLFKFTVSFRFLKMIQ